MNQMQLAASSQSSKPSWRSAKGVSKPEGKLWSTERSPRPAGFSRGFKLFASFTVLLALAAFYVVFLFRGDLRPTVLIFPISEYAYPWTPNGWAMEDANYLVSEANESSKFYAVKAQDRQDRSWEEWLDAHLNQPNFIAGGPGSAIIFPKYQSLIVYLSGHMDTDATGAPCLLVPRGGSSQKSVSLDAPWFGVDPVPLKQVLEKLCKGMNARKRNWWSSQTHRKLIVLDIGKLPPRLQIGETSSQLHDEIRKVVESLNEPHLAVLLSCGPRQRAWTLPERGGSIFGLHFARALSGAADPKGSGRIHLQQMESYLTKHVDETAKAQRMESQTPVCYRGAVAKESNEKASNFEIAFSSARRFSSPPIASNRSDFHLRDRVDDAWNRYSKWQARMVGLDPWATNEVLSRLSIAESLLIAGPALDATLKRELDVIESLLSHSVPPWPQEGVGGQSKVLQHDLSIAEILPADREKIVAWLEQTTQADGKMLTEPPVLNPRLAIAYAWHWVVSPRGSTRDLSVEQWQRVAALMERASASSENSIPSRDSLLMESIVQAVRDALGQSNPLVSRMIKAIPRLLDAHRKLEELNHVADPRMWQWMEGQRGLHQVFFEALDHWLLATGDGLQRSEARLTELLGSASEESKLILAKEYKRALESGWQLQDELSLLLPTMHWIADHEPYLVPDKERIDSDLTKFFQLHSCLTQPKVDSQAVTVIKEVDSMAQTLRGKLFASAQRLAGEQSTIDPKSRRDISLWLQQAVDMGGSPSTRSILRKKLLRVLEEPTALTNASDQLPSDTSQEASNGAQGTATINISKSSSRMAEAWWRETQRALSDSNPNTGVDAPDRSALVQRKRIAQATSLSSERVKSAVAQLNTDSKQAQARNDVIAIAWSSRLLAPFSVSSNSACPTRYHWAIAYQLERISHANQALDDFWTVPARSSASPESEYFSVLAGNYLRLAESVPTQTKADGLAYASLTKQCRADLENAQSLSRSWESKIWSNLPTKPIAETFLNPEFCTPGIEAGTIVFGSQIKSPAMVSDRKQTIRIETTLSGSSSLPPLRAFLRGRISDGFLNIAKQNSIPQLEWNLEQRDTRVRVTSVVSPRQILFVLDCSDSFDEQEHERSKESLLAILDRLPEEDTEVGLLVFGHIARWKLQDGTCDFAEDVASKLGVSLAGRTPENDIDLLVGMKKLNDQTKSEFQSKCASLKKFGFTPLYASIDRGREVLIKAKRADFSQHLVIVTDGGDNVYTDSKGNSIDNSPIARRYPFQKPPSTLASELSQAGIKGHCIKYAFRASVGTVDSLPRLFEPSSIYDASNKDQLRLALGKILGLRSFSVAVDDKREERGFGETLGLRLNRPSQIEIKVVGSSASQNVVARGGEYFDVRFDPALNAFRYAPVDEKQFATSLVPKDKSDQQSRVSVLTGDRQGLTRLVRIGIAPVIDSRPPVRPARVWAELKMAADETVPDRIVTVSDVQWESEKRSPVFRIPMQQGRIKEIRIWFSFQEGNPNKLFLSNWLSQENKALADRMSPPEKSPDATVPWSVTIKPPSKDRIRWSIAPQTANSSKAIDLKRIAYKLGLEPSQTYTFNEQPSDIVLSYESMPEVDRPNTDGWLTTDWMTVDPQ